MTRSKDDSGPVPPALAPPGTVLYLSNTFGIVDAGDVNPAAGLKSVVSYDSAPVGVIGNIARSPFLTFLFLCGVIVDKPTPSPSFTNPAFGLSMVVVAHLNLSIHLQKLLLRLRHLQVR